LKLFGELTHESLPWRFAVLHFAARELPFVSVAVAFAPLTDQDAAVAVNDTG
jgi:hypothetical protein